MDVKYCTSEVVRFICIYMGSDLPEFCGPTITSGAGSILPVNIAVPSYWRITHILYILCTIAHLKYIIYTILCTIISRQMT